MILSNEPGYYHYGSFGIRIENLVRIVPAETPHNFQGRGFLTFETISLCPIQVKALINIFRILVYLWLSLISVFKLD